MAVHRPLVLQYVRDPLGYDSHQAVPFKDGVRLVRDVFEPVTVGRTGSMTPADWAYKILGKGDSSGIALSFNTAS